MLWYQRPQEMVFILFFLKHMKKHQKSKERKIRFFYLTDIMHTKKSLKGYDITHYLSESREVMNTRISKCLSPSSVSPSRLLLFPNFLLSFNSKMDLTTTSGK